MSKNHLFFAIGFISRRLSFSSTLSALSSALASIASSLQSFIQEVVANEAAESISLLVSITLPVDPLLVLENPVNSSETETELEEDIVPSENIWLNLSEARMQRVV